MLIQARLENAEEGDSHNGCHPNQILCYRLNGRCGRVQRIRRRLIGTQSSSTRQIEAKTGRNYIEIEYLDFCMNRLREGAIPQQPLSSVFACDSPD